MAWTEIQWSCGHTGTMQLYGKNSTREAGVSNQAGKRCMACWLIDQWEKNNDPRCRRRDRYVLAGKIAEGKGRRIENLPEDVPIKTKDNPLANFSDVEILAEAQKRGLV